MSPLGAPPPDPTNRVADDERAARLGQRLFFDARLSSNGEISCATCHEPALELSDGRRWPRAWATTSRRSPTLWNVAHQRWLFWDGRADSLWAQALQPIESELEMGGDRLAVARTVAGDPRLRASYEALFGPLPPLDDAARFPARRQPMPEAPDDPRARAWAAMRDEDRRAVDRVFANVGKALAAYERRLVTRRRPSTGSSRGCARTTPRSSARWSRPRSAGCSCSSAAPAAAPATWAAASPTASSTTSRCRPGTAGRRATPGATRGGAAGGRPVQRRRAALRRPALGRRAHRRAPRRGRDLGRVPHPDAARRGAPRAVHAPRPVRDLDAVLHFYSTLEGAAPGHAHQERVLVPLQLSARELADLKAFLTALEAPAAAPEWLQPPPQPGG